MAERARYELEEEQALREAFARGEAVSCPRCNVLMTARGIGGGSFGLGYARRRTWLLCGECNRSVIFDVRRGTRT
ncbi:MAG TPA: hypothetical protein VFK13_12050 [Gemmatimonadaceae bacterium]|nr:hypothetical protein [Gemmatimonadaceae bacterium]